MYEVIYINELFEIIGSNWQYTKANLKNELVIFKTLPRGTRIQHILEYYRLYLLIMAAILFFAGAGIYRIFNPPKEVLVHIAWMAGYEHQETINGLSDDLTIILADDPENQTVEITPFMFVGSPEMDMAIHSRLAAMIAARDIDILIGTKVMDPFGMNEPPIWALDTIYPFLEDYQLGSVLYFVDDGWDPLPLAVMLGGSSVFESLGICSDERFIAVVSNTTREDMARRALQVILEVE